MSKRRGAAPPRTKPAKRPNPQITQAVDLMKRGQFAEAAPLLRAVLKAQPRNGLASNLLGAALMEQGDFEEAEKALARAVKIEPGHAAFALNFGQCLYRAGKFQDAIEPLKKAVSLSPDNAIAHALLGDAYREASNATAARTAYEQALRLKPGLPPAELGLGLLDLTAKANRSAQARFSSLAKTLSPGRQRAIVLSHLSSALNGLNQRAEANLALLQAIALAPEEDRLWQSLARGLAYAKEAPAHKDIGPVLLSLLQRGDVNPRPLTSVVADFLKMIYRDSASGEFKDGLISDPVFLALLENAPLSDVELEQFVTAQRAQALFDLLDETGSAAPAQPLKWLIAIARQCFLNEFVFYVSPEEDKDLTKLQEMARSGHKHALVLVATYRLITPADLDGVETDDDLRPVLMDHIENPAKERQLAETVPCLRPLENEVSLNVQAMYEDNPYPRWTKCDLAAPIKFQAVLESQLPHLDLSDVTAPEQPRILIAGCGTGLQTMKVRSSYKDASILSVDLSLPSIAYGLRKEMEYGVSDVEHMQADILDLDLLDEQFDLVESFGVIHHMEDPRLALQKLTNRLKPGGVLFLGLYSEIGRQSVLEARRLIAEKAYPHTPSGIREARRDIMASNDPRLKSLLSPASDFWALSDTRDLIFHVQEHRFTLLQIEDMLQSVGLDFLGLSLQNPADRALFDQENDAPEAAMSLAAWHAFETRHPDMFGDTYRIWARKPKTAT